MLKQNIQIFLLFLVIVILFILFKNGNIFDLGRVFRFWLGPQETVGSLYLPPEDLAEDYKDLLVENNQLKTLKEENEELRELLDFKNARNYQLIMSNILSRDPVNKNILIIDVGKQDNIEVGQAAVVNNGIIIGKVIDVGADSSKVRMLTDSFSRLAVTVGDTKLTSGILTGSLGLVMDLSYIPQEQEVKKGDLIVTADLDPKIPPGLVIGQLESVEFAQGEIFKQASVLPLINYDTINILAVVGNL